MGLTAAVMLGAWLFPLGLPVLCRATPPDAQAGCEHPMPVPDGMGVLAAASQHLPCAIPALCGVPTSAVPTASAVVLAAPPFELPSFFNLTPLHPGAPRAPLPPPPQA